MEIERKGKRRRKIEREREGVREVMGSAGF